MSDSLLLKLFYSDQMFIKHVLICYCLTNTVRKQFDNISTAVYVLLSSPAYLYYLYFVLTTSYSAGESNDAGQFDAPHQSRGTAALNGRYIFTGKGGRITLVVNEIPTCACCGSILKSSAVKVAMIEV